MGAGLALVLLTNCQESNKHEGYEIVFVPPCTNSQLQPSIPQNLPEEEKVDFLYEIAQETNLNQDSQGLSGYQGISSPKEQKTPLKKQRRPGFQRFRDSPLSKEKPQNSQKTPYSQNIQNLINNHGQIFYLEPKNDKNNLEYYFLKDNQTKSLSSTSTSTNYDSNSPTQILTRNYFVYKEDAKKNKANFTQHIINFHDEKSCTKYLKENSNENEIFKIKDKNILIIFTKQQIEDSYLKEMYHKSLIRWYNEHKTELENSRQNS